MLAGDIEENPGPSNTNHSLTIDPSNYRPVSLLFCTGKLLETVVFKELYNHLHENNLLYFSQVFSYVPTYRYSPPNLNIL